MAGQARGHAGAEALAPVYPLAHLGDYRVQGVEDVGLVYAQAGLNAQAEEGQLAARNGQTVRVHDEVRQGLDLVHVLHIDLGRGAHVRVRHGHARYAGDLALGQAQLPGQEVHPGPVVRLHLAGWHIVRQDDVDVGRIAAAEALHHLVGLGRLAAPEAPAPADARPGHELRAAGLEAEAIEGAVGTGRAQAARVVLRPGLVAVFVKEGREHVYHEVRGVEDMHATAPCQNVGIGRDGHAGHVHVDEAVPLRLVPGAPGYLHDAADAGRDEFLHAAQGKVPIGRYPLFHGKSHVLVAEAHQLGGPFPIRQETLQLVPFPTQHFQELLVRAGLHILATFRKAIICRL